MPKKIVFPAEQDLWDPISNRFVDFKEQTLVIEHSLISISKWESKWKKPFVSEDQKTTEEWLDYIKCMTLNNVDESIYDRITGEVFQDILSYIEDPMTATTFSSAPGAAGKKEVVTAEIIYYNMISYGLPIEFEKWHFNRLITLLRVFSIKNGGTKKMSQAEAAAYQRSINESRRAKRRR